MIRIIESLTPIYDNGRTRFYLVAEYQDRHNRAGTIQLETVEGRPKMFRVALVNGSGRYFKNLSDALAHVEVLGGRCPGLEVFQSWLEVDKEMWRNWQDGIFDRRGE